MADRDEFATDTAPYRRELLAHCYRMLGSVDDAEDLVQETMLRAWRAYDNFEGRASLRTWLYRIATNACLNALEHSSRRVLPSGLAGPDDNPLRSFDEAHEIPWLQPLPDALGSTKVTDPAAIVAERAETRLALVAAWQHLPPRQRAVLILRDVLHWKAAEVAELLGASVAAVNSALQRARATVAPLTTGTEELTEPTDPAVRAVLDRFVAAFEAADMNALTALLAEDAEWEMPPIPQWFRGNHAIVQLITVNCAPAAGTRDLVRTSANGQPAFALYLDNAAFSVLVVTPTQTGIQRITSFHDPALFESFGLPKTFA